MKTKGWSMGLMALLWSVSTLVQAAALNSAALTTATLQAIPHCLQLHVLGTCVWFSPLHGYSTTPLVEEYLPDAVVSVFNGPGQNPWMEMSATLDSASAQAERPLVSSLSGFLPDGGQHSQSLPTEQNVFFKQADVIGNPGLTALPSMVGLLLPSTAQPLKPYYQSMLDAAMWRGLPDYPSTLIEEGYSLGAAVTRYVGVGPINWGSVYPHEGKVATSNDAKAAAVVAQRAGDIVTSTFRIPGHVYQPLSNICGQHCQAAPVHESSSSTQFQLVYPNVNQTCDYFGKTLRYGDEIETQTNGAYAWIIWRYYRGCQDGDGQFVQEITI